MGFEFLARGDLQNMMTLVFFSGFSFIPHLTHQFVNFRRSLHKRSAANCTFLPVAHRTMSSANWDFEFCLWWGFVKSLTYIRKSNGLGTEPCGIPAMGLILSERKPFTSGCFSRGNCNVLYAGVCWKPPLCALTPFSFYCTVMPNPKTMASFSFVSVFCIIRAQ